MNMAETKCNNTDAVFTDNALLRYIELQEAEEIPMTAKEQMAYYMVWLLWGEPAGTAYAVFLDERHRFLKSLKIKDNRLWQAQLFAALDDCRTGLGAVYYFVGHNHVGTPLIPSPEDRAITGQMQRYEGMQFSGHFITDGALGWVEIE